MLSCRSRLELSTLSKAYTEYYFNSLSTFKKIVRRPLCTLCTLVKMMTILDDPLCVQITSLNFFFVERKCVCN